MPDYSACVVKETGEIGVILNTFNDPLEYDVQSRGQVKRYRGPEIARLEPGEILIISQALENLALAIDTYHEDNVYGIVYDEEGKAVFSKAAEAALRAINYPMLIVELRRLREGR